MLSSSPVEDVHRITVQIIDLAAELAFVIHFDILGTFSEQLLCLSLALHVSSNPSSESFAMLRALIVMRDAQYHN